MKVFWTDRAKFRLKQIHEHIAADSQVVANKTISRILFKSLQIGQVPYTGRQVPEYQHEQIREMLERPYRIIYRIASTDSTKICSVFPSTIATTLMKLFIYRPAGNDIFRPKLTH